MTQPLSTKNNDPREIAGEWIGSLIEKGKTEYQAFEVLADMRQASPEALRIRQALCDIMDILLTEELHEANNVRTAANQLLQQPTARIAPLFEQWAACLKAVQPHRRRMSAVCANFPAWIEKTPPELREEALRLLPDWLGAHGPASIEWLHSLAKHLAEQPAPESRAKLLEISGAYTAAVTTESAARALETCVALINSLPLDVLDAFYRACPAEAVFQDAEASDFFEAFTRVFPSLDKNLKQPFIRLMTELTAQSFSSAGYLVPRLPRVIAALPEEDKNLYLEYFRRIVTCAGIAANRFAFKIIPQRMMNGSRDALERLIDTIEAIGVNYGRFAAISFLEKTLK